MIDENVLRYIPKKYHHMIKSLIVEKNAEYDEETGKMKNHYIVEFVDGYRTIDGNEEMTVTSIRYLKFSFEERVCYIGE